MRDVFGHLGLRTRAATFSVASILAVACSDPGGSKDVGPASFSTRPGEALTAPSQDSAHAITQRFVADRRGLVALGGLEVVSQSMSPVSGRTHLRLRQVVNGLPVVDGYVKATIASDGSLLHLIDHLAVVPPGGVSLPARDDDSALDAALAYLGLNAATPFHETPKVEAVAYVPDVGGLEAGYLVQTWTVADNQLHETLIDDGFGVVSDELRTNNDAYNVFVEDPLKGDQVVVSSPGPTVDSPDGWLGTGSQTSIKISGNNTRAYLDVNADNVADPGGTSVTDGNFLTAVDLAASPSTASNKNVSVQNLFYLTNVVHDVLYRHGFTEVAGNFQVDNFGKGGIGADPVLAEAQDGGGTDNANFATPADGSSPRMQMYLWSSTAPELEVVSALGTFGARGAGFGPKFASAGVTASIALVNDGAGTTSDGCEAFSGFSGRIALLDRGNCNFDLKVLNAQKAGAVAVLVANNDAGPTFVMGGGSGRIRIPSAMVSQADGNVLRAGTTGTVRPLAVPPPMIDGSIDSDIVLHEYGHGLTWRMIGGMSGKLAGAIGEGASDALAMLINGGDVVGEYAYSNPAGIRRYPYANYPLTYGDVTGAEVHNDGEVYAAIVYRLMEIFDREGISRDVLFDYFVDGMNYTVVTPAYEDMRDGMIQAAALEGLGHECLIWEAFAQFGVGVGADGSVTKRGGVRITESFAKPVSCP